LPRRRGGGHGLRHDPDVEGTLARPALRPGRVRGHRPPAVPEPRHRRRAFHRQGMIERRSHAGPEQDWRGAHRRVTEVRAAPVADPRPAVAAPRAAVMAAAIGCAALIARPWLLGAAGRPAVTLTALFGAL